MKLLPFLVAIPLATLAAPSAAQIGPNLLQNGGFEGFGLAPGQAIYQSSYGPWTSVQGTTAALGMPYAGIPAFEGTGAMHVGDAGGPGYVDQTVATAIGSRYRVSVAVIGWQGAGGSVQVVVSGSGGTALSGNCPAPGGNTWGTCSFDFTATSSPSNVRIQNASGACTIDDVRCVLIPADDCADALVVGIGQNGTFTNVGATTSAPSWPCAGGGLDVWFKFTPSVSGLATASLCGANFDTALQIFSGNCGGLTSIACNDDLCGLQSQIAWPAFCGVDYFLRVGGYNGATGTFPLDISLVPSQTTQEIELSYTTSSVLAWNDAGSGGNYNGSFWVPTIPAGNPGVTPFGFMARAGYGQPLGMVVGRALTGTAFAPPTSFQLVWTDAGSGANLDGCFWVPVPPPGYRVLGHTMRNCGWTNPPLLSEVVCVRADLCCQGSVGNLIYNDAGSGANSDFSAWDIVAPPGALDIGGFVGHASHAAYPGPVWCLRADAVVPPAAPSSALLSILIASFGPVLKLHPGEVFLPDDPAAILDDPNTTVWGELVNQNYSTFNETFLTGTGRYTSSTTILDDVQPALSDPNTGNPEFLYRLDWDTSLNGGNLNRAKAYVRVQPLDGVFIELQFWIFYPWNGPGKSEASCGSLPSVVFNPTGANGSHFSDWENIRVRVSNKTLQNPGVYSLRNVVLSRHSSDEEVAANDPRLTLSAGRPVIYVAKDSHAHYLTAGTQYYARPSSTNIGFCTAYVDLFDLTANGGPTLDCSSSSKYQIVSSAWPSVATTTPNWYFFGGQWGGFGLYSFCVTAFGFTLHCETEVANGKLGLPRRNEFRVSVSENANLGRLLTSAGPLSPPFNQSITNYSMTVSSTTSTIDLTPLAMDPNAVIEVDLNGAIYPIEIMGPTPSSTGSSWSSVSNRLLGKASEPLPLVQGINHCYVTVSVPGAVKVYQVDITRSFPVLPHACGPITIATSASSSAGLGQSVQTSIGGYGSGLPFIGLGFLPSSPFCGCTIGHSWTAALFANTHTLNVPSNPVFLGVQIAIQGAGFLTPGGCANPMISFSDTIVVTIGQ